jgi:hypothetical protein
VDNGKLMLLDGDRTKGDVEQNILTVILEFLENHKASS